MDRNVKKKKYYDPNWKPLEWKTEHPEEFCNAKNIQESYVQELGNQEWTEITKFELTGCIRYRYEIKEISREIIYKKDYKERGING